MIRRVLSLQHCFLIVFRARHDGVFSSLSYVSFVLIAMCPFSIDLVIPAADEKVCLIVWQNFFSIDVWTCRYHCPCQWPRGWSLFLFFPRCFVPWAHSSCYDYRVSTTWPHPVSLRSTARSSTSPRHETAIVYQQPLILCSLECVYSASPLFGTFCCRSKSACRIFIIIVSYQKMCRKFGIICAAK